MRRKHRIERVPRLISLCLETKKKTFKVIKIFHFSYMHDICVHFLLELYVYVFFVFFFQNSANVAIQEDVLSKRFQEMAVLSIKLIVRT